MIKTLDRYVIRTFLYSLLMVAVAVLVLRVVIDVLINIDEFTEESGVGLFGVIGMVASYYGYQIFLYIMEMGGMMVVLAAGFTIYWMNLTNELTAMLASGVSLHRVVWPIIIVALMVSGLIVLDQELVIPNVKERLAVDANEIVGQPDHRQIWWLLDSEHSLWQSMQYSPADKRMDKPLVVLRDKDLRYLAYIHGAEATPHRQQVAAGRKEYVKGWLLRQATLVRAKSPTQPAWPFPQTTERIHTSVGPLRLLERTIEEQARLGSQYSLADLADRKIEKPLDEDPRYAVRISAEAFLSGPLARDDSDPDRSVETVVEGTLLEPRFEFLADDERSLATILADRADWVGGLDEDAHWELTNGRLFHATNLTSDDLELRGSSRWMDFLSSRQLSKLLEMQRGGNLKEVRLTKYLRFANPLNQLVMLLLGLPFILSRERNLKTSAGLAVLVVGAFYVFITVCRYMGIGEFWSAFLPVLLFGPISVLMLDSIKT